VDAIVRPGEPLPDLFFFALEEVMRLCLLLYSNVVRLISSSIRAANVQ